MLAKVGLRERTGDASALGIDSGWWRWSSRFDTGVLYLVWDFSDRGVSVILAAVSVTDAAPSLLLVLYSTPA